MSYIAECMRIGLVFLLSLVLVTNGLCQGSDLALTGAKIYPSPSEPPIDNGIVLIHDGQILAVGQASTVKIPHAATVMNCHGLTVTAGFWNNHVHTFTPGLIDARDSSAKELDGQLETMFNRWGFTTVFDLSSVLDNTLALRSRIESGELRGPRILTVGEPIWTMEPVYARDFLAQNHISVMHIETPEQAVALVRDHAAKGANGIKLFTGSYQGQGKVALLPVAVAKAAVVEAHRHGMPVFAHPQNVDGVDIAISSGVDVLAHTVPQSPPWTPDFTLRLQRAHLALIPTLTLFDFEARKEHDSDQEREAWLAKMVAELRAYSQAGGEILFGTDIGYIDHYDTTMEFTLMSQAGMNYRDILTSLTTNPARKFGGSNRTGRIAKGADADLVVLNADPAQDITAFAKVHYTIRKGKVIYQEQ
jgi:imidazolonepropionase-like amidohydrolase